MGFMDAARLRLWINAIAEPFREESDNLNYFKQSFIIIINKQTMFLSYCYTHTL